jgi:hypothetical protein
MRLTGKTYAAIASWIFLLDRLSESSPTSEDLKDVQTDCFLRNLIQYTQLSDVKRPGTKYGR